MSARVATERAYGCTLCQDYHYESEPTFEAHIWFQSKHGIERRPLYIAERFAQIVAAPPSKEEGQQ